MNKLLLTAVSLMLSTALAADPSPLRTYAMNNAGSAYDGLATECAWLAVVVPMSAMNYSLPAELTRVFEGGDIGRKIKTPLPGNITLGVTGMPPDTTIALTGMSKGRDYVLMHVKVTRKDTGSYVNALANLSLKAGDTVLTTVSIPVQGVPLVK